MTAGAHRFASPAPRLLAAARALHAFDSGVRFVAPTLEGDAAAPLAGAGPGMRIVTLGWIGTHPDASDSGLRAHWDLEEAARATGAGVLALRLAPLVGAASPLMAWLARRPGLDARARRALMQPVAEADAVGVLARALAGEGPAAGMFEICGRDVMNLGELMDLAVTRGATAYSVEPECEPGLAILGAQGMSEWEPWAAAFAMQPTPVGIGPAHEAAR